MRIVHLSFRPFSRPSRLYIIVLPASNKCLLPNLSFRHFSRPSPLFPPIFTPHLNLACNAFYKCILSIFLSVTFSPPHPFSALFPASFKANLACFTKCILPIFLSVTSPRLFAPFPSYLNIFSHASNKFVLLIFLSVAFLDLPAFTYSLACF
jgi:hypothetical protein